MLEHHLLGANVMSSAETRFSNGKWR